MFIDTVNPLQYHLSPIFYDFLYKTKNLWKEMAFLRTLIVMSAVYFSNLICRKYSF